jgi:hypothetical protein
MYREHLYRSHKSAKTLEGITPDMESRLKERKRDQTEERRWVDVYTILFPGEGVPSPCKRATPQLKKITKIFKTLTSRKKNRSTSKRMMITYEKNCLENSICA